MQPITSKGVYKAMRKRTTTKQLQQAITKNLLHIAKVDFYYKTTRKTETIDTDKFKENLDFLCESSIFSDFVDWHYEKDLSGNDGYIAESGAMNLYSENVVTVYLRKNDSITDEEIQEALLFEESEE